MSQAAPRPAAEPPCPLITPVRFEVSPGQVPSEQTPVRIFLGTEPAQYRAERVFMYALHQVRNPARVYEVYRMSRLPGFDQGRWRTGFTNFRFAIPQLAGSCGRAIYNDVDQIYTGDPGTLFDLPMGDAGYLALTAADTAVMLLDCARMAVVWTLERARRLDKKNLLELAAEQRGLWAPLPTQWHARDTEYQAGFTQCLHYTALNLQPWQPAPDQYSYHPHPLGELWLDLERSADAAGYQIFSAQAPSRAFADGAARLASAPRHVAPADLADFARLTDSTDVATLGPLDLNAVAGMSGRPLRPEMLGTATADLIGFARLDQCPPDDLPWLIETLFAAAHKAVYLMVDRAAAQEPANDDAYWRWLLQRVARRHPGRCWRIDLLDAAGHCQRSLVADFAARSGRPNVWLLYGKHAGDNAQLDVLAAELAWPTQVRRLHFSILSRLPGWLKGASRCGLQGSNPALAPPWPGLVLAAGRRSGNVARWIVRQSGGSTRSVLIGRPRAPLAAFDLVLTTPQYGLPARSNVLHLPVPLGRLAAPDATLLDQWRERWSALPRPWIGLLVGGDRAPYRLDPATARRLGEAASTLTTTTGGSLLVTTGPRTRPAAADALFAALPASAFRHRYAAEQADNPYPAVLALADQFLVTSDSASMLGEAAATGKPLAVFPLPAQRRPVQGLFRWLESRLGLIERAVGSRGTARQQNALGRAYDRLLAAGIVSRERDLAALRQALGVVTLPEEPAPPLLSPALLGRAQREGVERVRELLAAGHTKP